MGNLDLAGGSGGAASGAGVGSAFGPIGTGVGAVAGGLLGLFGRKKKKPKKISTLDKTQKGIYNQYAQGLQGQGQFADLFNFDSVAATKNFNSMYAQPAYQQFQEEVVPGITGQFRGGNLQNSSYLGGALTKAGSDVQKNLDTQLANMLYQGQNDSVNRRINGINNLLNMQTFAYQKPQESAGDKVFGSLLDVGGKAAGSYFNNKFAPSGGAMNNASNGSVPYDITSTNKSSLPNFSYKPPGSNISMAGGG